MVRNAVLETALKLFSERGFEQVSMADIAQVSGHSLEDLYGHFPSKADIVLSFYHRLAVRLEERLSDLDSGTLAARFAQVMKWKTELLEPHRTSLLALFGKMSDDQAEIGVLSRSTEPIRVRVTGVFAVVVYGAQGVEESPGELVRLLYRLHLGLTWIWLKEPRLYPGLLAASKAMLTLSSPLLPYHPVQSILKSADRFSGALAAPHDLQWDALAEKICRRIFLRRRLLGGNLACSQEPCPQCLAPHLAKIQVFLDREEPIHMVLPAFPAKSPNPEKTLGKLPDLGEQLALRTLQTMCEEIADLYPPGARVTICSDGHVFSDLVEVSDEDVTAYHNAMGDLIAELGHTGIDLFSLADIHTTPDYPKLRGQLMEHFGEPIEVLRERCKTYSHHGAMLDGIHRFIFEDRVVLYPEQSRSKNRKLARPIAYQVVARSNAWSRLVAEHFPSSVRLSIHPQPYHSEKIGFLLTKAVDNWITPWHGSILLEDDEFTLLKRKQAEDSGARLVESGGRHSHFEAV